ncbi:MAG: hypothetical protein PHX87_03280 [Candidatus Peribacteraceae bacterium]|nr:hypothetical protein [Candidatus Peribacteraceae bacterium]MDD5742430.1 hypothetical protein [Candidatus Peribacteraceae bacterium]
MNTSASDSGFSFQAKDQAEAFQFYYHQHWIRLVWPLCRLLFWNILIAGTGIIMLTGTMFAEPLSRRTILAILTAFFLLAHFEFLARLYHYLLYVIVVTDRKIHRIKKTLLTMDDHESTDLWVLQDIHKRQHGLIQNLFGYGTMILQAQETEVRIHFTPNINKRYAALTALRERARAYARPREDATRNAKAW